MPAGWIDDVDKAEFFWSRQTEDGGISYGNKNNLISALKVKMMNDLGDSSNRDYPPWVGVKAIIH